jgi:uncharacterized repeat protein (TIGR03833 family)
MSAKDSSNEKLEVGMTVEVNPQSDRSHKKIIQGIISEILTKADHHPHGILVNLESGETGRVKRVIDGVTSSNSAENSTKTDIENLISLIKEGEDHMVEFKSDALWSTHFTNDDINNHKPQTKELHAYGQATSKIIIAKTLAGFLNSDGGTLIIGVRENKKGGEDQVIGIEREFKSLKDSCQDGYRRMIVDLIKDYFSTNIFNHLNKYFHIDFEEVNNLTVCGIKVSKSDKKAFIKLNNTDHFYIRTDASTRELTGEETVDYCQTRFR